MNKLNLSQEELLKSLDNFVVKQDVLMYNGIEYFLSTVELFCDHSFGIGEPQLFETMIFDRIHGGLDFQLRYPTREKAINTHLAILNRLVVSKQDIYDILHDIGDEYYNGKL